MRKLIAIVKKILSFQEANYIFYIVILSFLFNSLTYLYLTSNNNKEIPLSPDSRKYLDIGISISNCSSIIENPLYYKGRDFKGKDIGQFNLPGYPVLISFFKENLELIVLFQILLNTFSLLLLYNSLKSRFTSLLALCNVLWIMIYTAWPWHNKILIESTTLSFLMISIFFLNNYLIKYNLRNIIFFTFSFIILVYLNNRFLFHYLSIISFWLIFSYFEKRIKIKFLLISVLIFILGLLPWHIRQYSVYNQLVLFSPTITTKGKKQVKRVENYEYIVNKNEIALLKSLNNESRLNKDKDKKNKDKDKKNKDKDRKNKDKDRKKRDLTYSKKIETNRFLLLKKHSKNIESPKKLCNLAFDTIFLLDFTDNIFILGNNKGNYYNIDYKKYKSYNFLFKVLVYRNSKISVVINNKIGRFITKYTILNNYIDKDSLNLYRKTKLVADYHVLISHLVNKKEKLLSTPETFYNFINDFSFDKYLELMDKRPKLSKFEIYWRRFVYHFSVIFTDFTFRPGNFANRIYFPAKYEHIIRVLLDVSFLTPMFLLSFYSFFIAIKKRDVFILTLIFLVLTHILLHTYFVYKPRYRVTILPAWFIVGWYSINNIVNYMKNHNNTDGKKFIKIFQKRGKSNNLKKLDNK